LSIFRDCDSGFFFGQRLDARDNPAVAGDLYTLSEFYVIQNAIEVGAGGRSWNGSHAKTIGAVAPIFISGFLLLPALFGWFIAADDPVVAAANLAGAAIRAAGDCVRHEP
jgi:hypothetical protein